MRARWILVLTTLWASVAVHSAEQANPTLELLEFLGEWETGGGEWIAPETLGSLDLAGTTDMNKEAQK